MKQRENKWVKKQLHIISLMHAWEIWNTIIIERQLHTCTVEIQYICIYFYLH